MEKGERRYQDRLGGSLWFYSLMWRQQGGGVLGGKGGAGGLWQIWQVSLCSSLHTILERSCSSHTGCWNLGNQLNKSWWGDLFLFFVSSTTLSSFLFRGGLSSCLATPPFLLLISCQVSLLGFCLPSAFISYLSFDLNNPSVSHLSPSPYSLGCPRQSPLLALHTCAPPCFLYLYNFYGSSYNSCADYCRLFIYLLLPL